MTAFITLDVGEDAGTRREMIASAALFVKNAAEKFTAAGFEVQTTRLATNSFEMWCDAADTSAALDAFRAIDAQLVELGVGFFNAGPAVTPAGLALVPAIVALLQVATVVVRL